MAAVLIHGGNAVWWTTPWDWKLAQAFYGVVVVAGYALVLVRFIPGERARA